MDIEKGVFLPSADLDSKLMVNCLQTLVDNYPSIKFTSIISDKDIGGFRLNFSGPEVKAVLKRNQLLSANEVIRICPLTTFLTIHDIGAFEHPMFDYDVLEAINKRFGKVLDVCKFDYDVSPEAAKANHKLYGDEKETQMKKWLVRIDVPEFEDFEIFEQFKNFPEIIIPLPKWYKNLNVTVLCRHCKKSGPLPHSCRQRILPTVVAESETIASRKSKETPESDKFPGDMLLKQSYSKSPHKPSEDPPPECHENSSSDSTDSYMKKVDKKETEGARNLFGENLKFMKNLKKERDYAMGTTTSGNLLIQEAIEVHETPADDNIEKYSDYKKHERTADVKGECTKRLIVRIKKEDHDAINKQAQNIKQESYNKNSEPENRTAPDDGEDTMFYKEDSKLYIDTAASNDNDEQLPGNTNTLPFQSDDSNSEEKGQETSLGERPRPGPSTYTACSSVLGAADTSVLSEELQGYINQSCDKCGVLDRQTLDAFLGFVKKKNKPAEIVVKYTKNVEGLKKQLQMILNLHYHTKPMYQKKEDAVFIKWLEGLVSRFDNTTKPRKRKHSDRNYD